MKFPGYIDAQAVVSTSCTLPVTIEVRDLGHSYKHELLEYPPDSASE